MLIIYYFNQYVFVYHCGSECKQSCLLSDHRIGYFVVCKRLAYMLFTIILNNDQTMISTYLIQSVCIHKTVALNSVYEDSQRTL